MKRFFHNTLVLSALVLSMIVSCGKDEPEVIPRSKLAKIYAEMLMTDQWISMTPGMRMIADTSLVYEPILEKYGYTSEDYRKSVEVYMDDPERYARILRESAQILDDRLKELKALLRIEDYRKEFDYEADFKPEEFFPYMFDEPYVHYYDSLAVEPDTLLYIYRMIPVERQDTIYDRLVMVVMTDSLSVSDTLKAVGMDEPADSVVADVAVIADTVQVDVPEPEDTVEQQVMKPGRRFNMVDKLRNTAKRNIEDK